MKEAVESVLSTGQTQRRHKILQSEVGWHLQQHRLPHLHSQLSQPQLTYLQLALLAEVVPAEVEVKLMHNILILNQYFTKTIPPYNDLS